MFYNPVIHHRCTIRLKSYNYSQSGMYFITICCQNHTCLFGKITDSEMILNDAGKMIEKWCAELSHKFPDIMLDPYIIMPNHFHAIIVNNGDDSTTVGADLRVCPDEKRVCPNELGKRGENMSGEHRDEYEHRGEHTGESEYKGEHTGSPLHAVVQWFKTMTTNEYIRGVKTLGWQPFDKKLWQRNYWEHIIRNEQSYQNITNYIINNPANWGNDKFYTK